MNIIEITALENGAHRNQNGAAVPPAGWAVVPEGMTLENFPFGTVMAEEVDGIMTVTGWVAGELPTVEEVEALPSELEQLRADVDFIAAMTGVEL